MKMLLPLYVHPVDSPAAWEAAALLPPDDAVIVNVHDGPGGDRDQCYVSAISRLYASDVPMLGYVDLDWGARDRSQVEQDIEGWHRYPVSGYFFDRCPTSAQAAAGVAVAMRATRGTPVVLNPGCRPHDLYADFAAIICTFEGAWDTYLTMSADDRPSWPNAAHLVYGVPQDELVEARRIVGDQVAAGLVTDLAMPLPYAGIPHTMSARPVTQRIT